GVAASVRLSPEAWGTELRLQESGQPGGEILTVSMRTRSGTWWSVGTYRTVTGGTVHVDLACAQSPSQIEAVYVRDAGGRTVLYGEIV
ncbi:MAG: hypothetical protein ACYDD6_02160, partial [Acidimicrobiales bacterium]